MGAFDTAKEIVRIGSTAGLGKDVIDLLEKKASLLAEQVAALESENAHLKLENAQLRQNLPHPNPGKQLSADQRKVLEFLNRDTTDEYIDFEIIARHAGFDLPKARFVLEQLEGLDYVWGTMYSPPGYHISPEGRALLYDTSA